MAHWQLGDQNQARHWYQKSPAWRRNKQLDARLQGFYREAMGLFNKDESVGHASSLPCG
jgi:hypothetical protein